MFVAFLWVKYISSLSLTDEILSEMIGSTLYHFYYVVSLLFIGSTRIKQRIEKPLQLRQSVRMEYVQTPISN